MALSETNTNNNNDNTNLGIVSLPLYGARLPVPPINRLRINPYRSAQTQRFRWSNNEEVAILPETLTKGQKMRLEDAFIIDQTTRRAVTLYAKFLLGKRTRTTIDVNKEFMTPEMQKEALQTTFSEQEVNELKTMIDKVNRQVKFRDKVEAGVIQSQVGGRSALLVEKQGQMPVDLKILNWGKLGRVYADKDTWQLLAVDYADRPKDKPLLAEEIIYFPWDDFHVSPDSLYMGTSKVLPVLDMSETLRLIIQEDLKESAKIGWANSGVIRFPPNVSDAKMREFVEGFVTGTWNATSQSVEIESHDLQPKLKEMMEIVLQGIHVIQMGLGIPSSLMGFEDLQNRASAELALHGFRESDLNHARSWLQGILEPQWFDSLVQIRYPDLDINEMWVKAKLEFEDVTFESLKDKSEAVIPLYQAGIIPLEKALKILDMEDVLEQMLAEQKRLQEQRKQDLEMMRLEREQAQDQNRGNGNGRVVDNQDEDEEEEEDAIPFRQRRASKEERQKVIEELKQAALAVPPVVQQQPQKDDTDVKRLAIVEHDKRMKLMDEQEKLVEHIKKQMARYE